HPLDAEGRATFDEHELRFAREPPHLVREQQATALLRPGAPGAELALCMRPAAHPTGLVFALDVDRRLSGHLREVFGGVPIVDSESLEDVHVGEERRPCLAVGALEL